MKHMKSAGFTIVESVVASSILLAILGGVMMQVNSIRASISKSEQLLALDAMESWVSPLISDVEAVKYSSTFIKNRSLQNCLNGRTSCRHGGKYNIRIRLKGQKEPISGNSSKFDRNGMVCQTKNCEAYRLRTQVITNCMSGNACRSLGYLTVRYDIQRIADKKVLRTRYLEVNRFESARFPNLSVSCPGNQVLKGVGISGEALCEKQEDIKFVNDIGQTITGNIDVKKKDCRASNQDPANDQYYIQGMNQNGDLLCAERFW